MNATLLEVSGLAAGYGDVRVLWNVDLAVRDGEIVALIGSNGAGKTTLLRVLSGLLPAAAGVISLAGETVTGLSAPDLVERRLIHVPEGRRLFGGLTVYDNLLLGAYKRGADKATLAADIDRVFVLFPRLAERRNQDATTLSGGEQQMCAIARGLMAAPRLLLIDELSLGLAPNIVDELVGALKQINADGTSLLVVEQDVLTALDLAHRAYVMDQGRTTLSGESRDLADNPQIRAAYLGI
jgi:branched-chain amino acid transport system ATP-binding protein